MNQAWRLFALTIAGFAWLSTSPASAAPPKLTYLFPAGAQRGSSVVVTAAGEFSSWPVEVWCDQAGVTIAAEPKSGEFRVTVAGDALPGVCWWRAHNAEGAAALRPFLIDQLPESSETEPNNDLQEYAEVALPQIVNGKLNKNGDVDGYRFQLKAGQTIVASLQANWQLGAPMDSILQVGEIVTRRVSTAFDNTKTEAFVLAQDHDTRGLDPLLCFTAPRDGVYFIRAFAFPSEPSGSVAFAGGDAYVYRLTLTTGGLAEIAFPMALSPQAAGEVMLTGWNMPFRGVGVEVPALPSKEMHLSRVFAPDIAGAVDLTRIDVPARTATLAAHDHPGEEISLPIAISDRLLTKQRPHHFRFSANKNDRIRIELTARELGLPLDGVLTIYDASGKELQSVDDAQKQADPELVFTAPADGEYRVTVRDLHDRGGERFAYRLLVAREKPDFALTLAGDAFVVAPDKPLEIPVTIERQAGFAGEVTVSVVGLPADVTVESAKSQAKGDSAKLVKLVLKSTSETKAWRGPVQVSGESSPEDRRTATFSSALPGVARSSATWLTVTEKSK